MKRQVYILVGICTAKKYGNRRNSVRGTWLKYPKEDVECLFFLGDKIPEGEESDTILVSRYDSYEFLPDKVLGFFRFAIENYDFDWLFKCDDDTYVDLSRLDSVIDDNFDLMGDVLVKKRNAPSGGAGYFLSRKTVETILSRDDLPVTGAEDLLIGKLASKTGALMGATDRLFAGNTKYPLDKNEIVTAHWCSPKIMQTIHIFRHKCPDFIYEGKGKKGVEEYFFYLEGVYKKKDGYQYGWWEVGVNGLLTLKGHGASTEQFVLKEGDIYVGSELTLSPKGKGRLIPVNDEEYCGEVHSVKIHLGCGDRKLNGWINLDLPNYDIRNTLPWEDQSVDGYFLEKVIEYITPEEMYFFLTEVKRTLKKYGQLRLAFIDIKLLEQEMSPAYQQFIRVTLSKKNQEGDSSLLDSLVRGVGMLSYWSEDSLTSFLKLAGFHVKTVPLGFSDNEEYVNLEREKPREDQPFELLGLKSIEAWLY